MEVYEHEEIDDQKSIQNKVMDYSKVYPANTFSYKAVVYTKLVSYPISSSPMMTADDAELYYFSCLKHDKDFSGSEFRFVWRDIHPDGKIALPDNSASTILTKKDGEWVDMESSSQETMDLLAASPIYSDKKYKLKGFTGMFARK